MKNNYPKTNTKKVPANAGSFFYLNIRCFCVVYFLYPEKLFYVQKN
jgi:hypothetical protein